MVKTNYNGLYTLGSILIRKSNPNVLATTHHYFSRRQIQKEE